MFCVSVSLALAQTPYGFPPDCIWLQQVVRQNGQKINPPIPAQTNWWLLAGPTNMTILIPPEYRVTSAPRLSITAPTNVPPLNTLPWRELEEKWSRSNDLPPLPPTNVIGNVYTWQLVTEALREQVQSLSNRLAAVERHLNALPPPPLPTPYRMGRVPEPQKIYLRCEHCGAQIELEARHP